MISTTIEPHQILDRPGLSKLLGLSDRCISREIRLGRLRCFVRAKRQWFVGSDVLAWLQSEPYQPGNVEQDDSLAGL